MSASPRLRYRTAVKLDDFQRGYPQRTASRFAKFKIGFDDAADQRSTEAAIVRFAVEL